MAAFGVTCSLERSETGARRRPRSRNGRVTLLFGYWSRHGSDGAGGRRATWRGKEADRAVNVIGAKELANREPPLYTRGGLTKEGVSMKRVLALLSGRRTFVWSGVASLAALLLGILAPLGVAAVGAQAPCRAAGATGLTAAKIARSGQSISGSVDASGCDVGIYVGPGTSHVVVKDAMVTGASDHGILVQNASSILIEDSTVTDVGANAATCPPGKPSAKPCINENKPIQLVGTTNSVVKGNLVTANRSDGGIGVADDGKIDPGALRPGIERASRGNLIEGNVVVDNAAGCGIVVAAYNPGAGVWDNRVVGNTVSGNVAGVVVAADSPATMAVGNVVENNTITGNFIPGVIVHSNTPGDVVRATVVEGNTIAGNGPDPTADGGHGPKGATGIVVVAEPRPRGFPAGLPNAILSGTQVIGNTVGSETTAVFSAHATDTTERGNTVG